MPTQDVVGPASVTPSGPYIPAGVDPAFPAGSQLVPGTVTAVPTGDRLIVSDDGGVGNHTYTIDNQRVARTTPRYKSRRKSRYQSTPESDLSFQSSY